MGRLQSELGESLRQRIELEAAVQQLQFELHAASAHAAAELSAERDERLRGASELGQVGGHFVCTHSTHVKSHVLVCKLTAFMSLCASLLRANCARQSH